MSDAHRPRLLRSVEELRASTAQARRSGGRVGFVPTMGALHRGHLRLVEEARARTDLVVVSVFVNPTQFGPGEDLDRYPSDLEADLRACAEGGVDLVFAPPVAVMYPEGHATRVRLSGLTDGLCGKHRPGHFEGVATVVATLFHQVGPCVAFFGRKDYQQLKVIERMVRDLSFEVEVIGVPTVREPDGLALSSRNAYLAPGDRARALALVEALSSASRLVADRGDPPRAGALRRAARAPMEEKLDAIDYVEICHPETLEPLAEDHLVVAPALVVLAGWLGQTRLIDNLLVLEEADPLRRR